MISEIYFRMTANNSQIGNIPLEPLFGNNENKSNIDQLIFVEIATTSQPLIQFTAANMIPSQISLIPHVPETSNIKIRQEGRRGRRQHRRQRRREQREAAQRRRRRQRRPTELQLQQRHEPEQQPRRQRSRTWSEIDREQEYWWSIGFPEYMEENLTPLLEAYEWEKMDPKIRWEQEQLNELEGFIVSEKLALIDDENEQTRQIELFEKSQEKEQQQRNYDELV